jgi:HEAT repeat protein
MGSMRDPGPALVLASAAAAVLLAGVFADRRPPDPAEAGFLRALGRLRGMRESRRIPPEGIGDLEYRRALDALLASAPPAALDRAVLDRADDAVLRCDLLAAASDAALARALADRAQPLALRLAALPRVRSLDVLAGVWRGEPGFPARHLLALALGGTGTPEALPLLRQALADPDESVRAHAALGLGELAREAAALDALRGALRDPARSVRENALRSLSRAPSAEPELRAAAADPSLRPLAEALLRELGR